MPGENEKNEDEKKEIVTTASSFEKVDEIIIGEKKEISATESNDEKIVEEKNEIIATESNDEKTDSESSTIEKTDSVNSTNGKTNNTKFWSNCGESIDINAEICPKCGVRVSKPQSSLDKNPTLAAILSFFVCGLGQIYNGELGKGLMFLFSFYGCLFLGIFVGAILMVVYVGFIILPLALLMCLIIWVYGIYDAYNTAQEMNNY